MTLTTKLCTLVVFSLLTACGPGADGALGNAELELSNLEYDPALVLPLLESPTADMEITTSWGKGRFKKDGDKFFILDTEPEGASVSIHWKTDYGREGICRHKDGATAAWRWCNKDFLEGHRISMQLGRCNADANHGSCDLLSDYGSSWTAWKAVTNDGG